MHATTIREPGPDHVERELLDLATAFATELGTLPPRGRVALDDSLDRDLGLGSLERVELLLRVERAFGVELADAVLAEALTPRDLVTAVRASPTALGAAPLSAALPLAPATRASAAARTLVDVLQQRVEQEPDRVHVVLLDEQDREHRITHGALWQRASATAAALRERGIAAGDTVALMLRTEPAFFAAFFGVLLAGATPVPVYPPVRADRLEEYAARQVGILRNAAVRMLLTFDAAARIATLLGRRVPSLREVTVVDRLPASPDFRTAAVHREDQPALIQYTSGSTGDPKGVLLTHANVLANIRALGMALDVGADDVLVSWLPLYHDMGLIGSWLGALYHGVPFVVLPPLAFLARPARWLRALHAHRGTLSPAPNFAFDLCVRKIRDEEIAGLDLARWRLALNGSEAVSADTIERFTRRFASFGFRPEAMCPVYGLAESAVGLTVSPPGRGPRVDRIARGAFERTRRAIEAEADAPCLRLVSCGVALPGHEVRIVDDAGLVVPDRVEGRIHFRGPSVTPGYFRNPEATRAVVHDGWVDSGDLGYRAGGELYVSGRRKDVIIKAGRNLYPPEVEEIVGEIPGIRKGCVAALGVADPEAGTERLVVVAETRARAGEERARLRAAVVDRVVAALGIPPDTVVIAAPGAILKTSSGKIRRSATRDAYVRGTLGRRRPARVQFFRLLALGAAAWVGRAARAAARLAYGAWVGVVLAVMVPVLAVLVVLAPARAVDGIVRRWCRMVLAASGCRIRLRRRGAPTRAPVVFASNHASYLDVVVLLAALPERFGYVAKRELANTWLVGRIIRKAGHLTVERFHLAESVADSERVANALRQGKSIFVFPEGTFVRAPGLLPFRLGGFVAAVETRCPVVPVTIRGTRDILPAGTWLPRAGIVDIVVGTPIAPEKREWREAVRLRDAVRAAIGRELDGP